MSSSRFWLLREKFFHHDLRSRLDDIGSSCGVFVFRGVGVGSPCLARGVMPPRRVPDMVVGGEVALRMQERKPM